MNRKWRPPRVGSVVSVNLPSVGGVGPERRNYWCKVISIARQKPDGIEVGFEIIKPDFERGHRFFIRYSTNIIEDAL